MTKIVCPLKLTFHPFHIVSLSKWTIISTKDCVCKCTQLNNENSKLRSALYSVDVRAASG